MKPLRLFDIFIDLAPHPALLARRWHRLPAITDAASTLRAPLPRRFDFDLVQLTPEAQQLLDTLAEVLKDARLAKKTLRVEGHTDSSGAAKYNLQLSYRRALAVQHYLHARHPSPPHGSSAIRRRGLAVDGGGLVKKAGLFPNVSLDKSEGLYAALRVLIELSTMEVLGKLTRVPYWQCLQIEQTNHEVQATTRDWFLTMSETERVQFVQRMLAQHGVYHGRVTGSLDQATREATGR